MPIDQNQAILAWFMTILIETMKRSKHPWMAWIDEHKDGACRALSALAAVGTGLGFTFSGSIIEGGNIAYPGIKVLLSNMLAALLAQQAIYQVVVKPAIKKVPVVVPSLPPVVGQNPPEGL